MIRQMILTGLAVATMAVSAATAPKVAAKKAPKKTTFTKFEEAVAAAKASERPILVFCSTKGSKGEAYYKTILKNPIFAKEVVKPNLIVLDLHLPSVKNGPWPDPTGLSSNALEVLNYALRSPRVATDKTYEHLYSGVVLIDSEGKKTLGAFLRVPNLQQPRSDTPLNLWLQTLVYFCEAQGVPLTVSPVLKKYMETDPDAKSDTKKGKK